MKKRNYSTRAGKPGDPSCDQTGEGRHRWFTSVHRARRSPAAFGIVSYFVEYEQERVVDASELTKWCRERLAPYKIPQYIEFRDMLPKSKVGKLLRREIRDEERRKTTKEKK